MINSDGESGGSKNSSHNATPESTANNPVPNERRPPDEPQIVKGLAQQARKGRAEQVHPWLESLQGTGKGLGPC